MVPDVGGTPNLDAGRTVLPAEVWKELLTHVQDVAQQVEQRLRDVLRDTLSQPPDAPPPRPVAAPLRPQPHPPESACPATAGDPATPRHDCSFGVPDTDGLS
jgi:hypothetical protein